MQNQIFAALGLVINENNELLITKRQDPDNPDLDGKWEIPGGGIEQGEDPVDALKREMTEETGLSVEPLTLLPFVGSKVWENPTEARQVFLVCYVCKQIDTSQQVVLNEEASEYQWATSKTITSLDYLEYLDTFIELAEEHLKTKLQI
jgi:mutator protein MutT